MSDNESLLGEHFILEGAKRVAKEELDKTGGFVQGVKGGGGNTFRTCS